MLRKENNHQLSFFTVEKRLDRMASLKDTLFRLDKLVPWEEFRSLLIRVRKDNSKKGGRPPYDEVMMFKCLVLQSMYNLSDEDLEFELLDKHSFTEFVGLTICSDVPDHNTIWRFRELLKEHNLIQPLFDKFDSYLNQEGIRMNKGLIVDATFVDVPKQHNKREENRQIKEGQTPESFEEKSIQELAHKDVDARWTKKNGEVHYGYKDHVMVDADHKIIRQWRVTSANVHDSKEFLSILPERSHSGQKVYADSAYNSSDTIAELEYRGFDPEICEKGHRNHPLTEEQKQNNRRKSQARCRVEHVFGDMKQRMKTMTIHTIGIMRAEVKIGLMNLAYNMCRYVSLTRKNTVKPCFD